MPGTARQPAARWLLALAATSAAALAAAFLLQYAGYEPCHLCYYERIPYFVVIVVGLAGLWLGYPRTALAIIALAFAANAGLAFFHVGVEQGWFQLPESCIASGQATSIEELRAQLAAAPARCDQVPLTVLGLSLAGWNGVLSAGLLVLTLFGLVRAGASAAEQHRQARAA
ncbi:disulfide bond formation protein B [Benzoatithermus flavus]|uniref:Disulfide bond formation protein B n=1 Tax=Benzoatithermus flavus TaxID=3108223 RepID=A0ABU8XW59_9PROT